MVKNPSWQDTDQLAICKHGERVELGATEKQLQLEVRAGLEPRKSRLQVQHPNHSTTLPPHLRVTKSQTLNQIEIPAFEPVEVKPRATDWSISLYKEVLTFESVDEILNCHHSNESY